MSIKPQCQPIHRSHSTVLTPSAPIIAPSCAIDNYSSVSLTPAKPNYPTSVPNIRIKSPSPDYCCRNIITPTKVKWALQEKNIGNFDHINKHNNNISNKANKQKDNGKSKAKQMQKQKYSHKNMHNFVDNQNQNNNRSGVYVQSWNTTPKRATNNDEQDKSAINYSHVKKQQTKQYINELQQQIRILTIQNRNLLSKLSQPLTACPSTSSSIPQSSSSASSLCINCNNNNNTNNNNPANPSCSYVTYSTNNTTINSNSISDSSSRQPGTSTTSTTTNSSKLIISKIKQQYQQQLSTLRIMVQHQIKQAVSVVQDMCQLMKSKILQIQGRVDTVDAVISQAKMARILQITQMYHKQHNNINNNNGIVLSASAQKMCGRIVGSKYMPASMTLLSNIQQHSLSDILCTSIPEQSQQQSKNNTIELATLQQQVQILRTNLNQLSQQNNKERQHLQQILAAKCAENYTLINKLEECQRKRLNAQRKIWTIVGMKGDQDKGVFSNNNNTNNNNNNNNNGGFVSSVKEQLRMLQKSVAQIGAQLARSQKQCEQLLRVVQQKNIQCQALNTQVSILRDKVLTYEKQRIFQQQKTRFLQGSVSILQSQLQQCKKSQHQLQSQRTKLQRQRIMRITGQTRSYTNSRNLLTVTSRIDTLLNLQQQRQNSIQKCMTMIQQLCCNSNSNNNNDDSLNSVTMRMTTSNNTRDNTITIDSKNKNMMIEGYTQEETALENNSSK